MWVHIKKIFLFLNGDIEKKISDKELLYFQSILEKNKFMIQT